MTHASHIKISIVIPCYNAEKSISKTVLSCIEQSSPAHELILVNDASSDGTLELIESFKTQFPDTIRVVTYDENRGVSHARNAGIQLATGDYIAFLDSDDTYHQDKLKVMQEYIFAFGENVYWHDYTYDLGSEKTDVFSESDTLPPVSLTTFTSLLVRSQVSTCTLVVPKNWQVRFDEKMRHCEDYDFVLRSSYIKSLIKIPIALTVVHRQINSAGGLSGDIWKMRQGEMYMYSKLYRLHPLLIFSQPIFWMYSLMKHLRMLLRRLF